MLSIGGRNNNSFINSYFSGANRKYDYATANTQKLQSALSSRRKVEVKLSKNFAEFRTTTKEFYGDFYPKMNDLKSAASKLKNTTADSVIAPTGAGSSNTKAVGDVSGSVEAPVTIDVSQVATGAKIDFSAVVSENKGDISGKSQISLKVGNDVKKVDLNISDKLSNKDALSQVVSQINAASTGATASIVEKDGKSTLQIQSNTTGKKGTIAVEVQGAMKSAVGGGMLSAGQNAIYKVGGETKTSESNKVNIVSGESKFAATLAGAGTATVAQKQTDSTKIMSAVKDFAKAYNSTVDFLSKNSAKSASVSNLAASFRDVKFSATALEKVGINVDSAGKLSLDETKLTETLAKDPIKVHKLISSSGGLADSAYKKSMAAVINSTSLIQAPSVLRSGKFNGSPVGALMDMFA